jgi:CheY-like chemotaxis protein
MGSRVILADDSVTIQKVVGIIFANEGYELTIVASGDDAVAKAREIKPDVMLVDALMPGKNGYEVCREIRQDPSLAHTAILLMTGAFEVVDEEKNRQSGADEFITKPFDSQTLIEVTNRLISLTGGRRAMSAAAPASQTLPGSFPQAAAPAPAAAPAVDDIWATGFDDEPEPAPAVSANFAASPSVAPVVPAPVKATADDDLWGAFDMDEFETAPASAPVVTAADHGFSFEAEAPTGSTAAGAAPVVTDEISFDEPLPEIVPTATGFEPVGEQEISFADLEPDMSVQPVAALPADD